MIILKSNSIKELTNGICLVNKSGRDIGIKCLEYDFLQKLREPEKQELKEKAKKADDLLKQNLFLDTYSMTELAGNWFPPYNPDYPDMEPALPEKRCECGAEKTETPGHSDWCPKFDIRTDKRNRKI